MPTFEIEQYELHAMTYRVEAASKAEAIAKLFAGEAKPVEQSQELIEVADDYGLPAEKHPELVRALRELGIANIRDVIPSIRSIEAVSCETGD
jgi:hypothetical protein